MSRALSPVLLEAPNRNVVEVRLEMILHVHPFKTIGGLRNRRFACFQYIWPLPGSIFALFCICMLFITINSFWFLFCVSVACKIHCSCFGDVNFKDVCCDCSTDNGPAMWRKKNAGRTPSINAEFNKRDYRCMTFHSESPPIPAVVGLNAIDLISEHTEVENCPARVTEVLQ